MTATSAPFDRAASGYDAAFTDTLLGARLRAAAWGWMDRAFRTGDRILELGCGTGVDAVHLAQRGVAVMATDGSPAMGRATQERAILRGTNDLVRFQALDMSSIGDAGWAAGLTAPFDGVLSDFGALNAVADRGRLFRALGGVVRPGGRMVLVAMGPVCPWEIAWHLLHGEPRIAARRWRAGATARTDGGGSLRVWYPSAGRVVREAAPWFEVAAHGGIGVALPPSGLSDVFQRRRGWLRLLAPMERTLGSTLVGAWASDHWVLDLVRRD